ncbi:MAG: AAA family ATPase [Planctomycetota bacterium]|nr:AAA family ATPase [Planctomycetota bacterium]
MHALSRAREALAAVDLRPGLPVDEVHTRLQQGLRLKDTGQRTLAFYLVEMDERRLYSKSGLNTTVEYAEARLDLTQRRTRELLSVGRKLLELPLIDTAFCEGEIGWAKVVELVRVVVPEHEAAWLERARSRSYRRLRVEVRTARPGSAPRDDGRGLPHVRFPVRAKLSGIGHKTWDAAKKAFGDEIGRPADDAEIMVAFAEMFLSSQADGSIPGRKPLDMSLYRIVVDRGPDPDGGLTTETELGPVEVEEAACIQCDGECVDPDGHPVDDGHAPKTPPALRKRVLKRDGGRCRCCGSRRELHVHHIVWRSKGGKTVIWNLITLCARCHALVHEGLLVLEGERAEDIRFLDEAGNPLHEPGEHVHPAVRWQLAKPPFSGAGGAAGARRDAQEEPEAPLEPDEDAFREIAGQDALIERIELAVAGTAAREKPFPHTLFMGPPGTGKTTLARAIGARIGARVHETAGPVLREVQDALNLLEGIQGGDVLFLDEIHAVPRVVLEAMYSAIDAREEPFTLIGATTHLGDLPSALCTRFMHREGLAFYADEQLAHIAAAGATREGFTLETDAGLRLASAARGTPRGALVLLEHVLNAAAALGRREVQLGDVEATLKRLGYDDEGLMPPEQAYLKVLRASSDPVSIERLALQLGSNVRTLVRNVEPFLFHLGLVRMTARGRVAAHRPRIRGTAGLRARHGGCDADGAAGSVRAGGRWRQP